MKMKKTVKAAIAASMAVAVFGVGAVSFAAWAGTATEVLPAQTGSLGTVQASDQGFDSTQAASWSWSGTLTGLVPYDQPLDEGSQQEGEGTQDPDYVAPIKMTMTMLPDIAMGDWDPETTYICLTVTSAQKDEPTQALSGTFYYQLYATDGDAPAASTTQTLEKQGWTAAGYTISLKDFGSNLTDGKLSLALIYSSDTYEQGTYEVEISITQEENAQPSDPTGDEGKTGEDEGENA